MTAHARAYQTHAGKEVLDARFPIRKKEEETESEALPIPIKKGEKVKVQERLGK